MAGGLGTRMRSETPKHLHPLLGKRLVDWVIDAARGLGPEPLVVVGWFSLAHRVRSDTTRQAWWIAAVSQALVVLVPIFVLIVGTMALILVGVLAVVALVLLFSSRD